MLVKRELDAQAFGVNILPCSLEYYDKYLRANSRRFLLDGTGVFGYVDKVGSSYTLYVSHHTHYLVTETEFGRMISELLLDLVGNWHTDDFQIQI